MQSRCKGCFDAHSRVAITFSQLSEGQEMVSMEDLWTNNSPGQATGPCELPSALLQTYEDSMILLSPPVVSAKLPGHKGQKQSCCWSVLCSCNPHLH